MKKPFFFFALLLFLLAITGCTRARPQPELPQSYFQLQRINMDLRRIESQLKMHIGTPEAPGRTIVAYGAKVAPRVSPVNELTAEIRAVANSLTEVELDTQAQQTSLEQIAQLVHNQGPNLPNLASLNQTIDQLETIMGQLIANR
jgi:hypothetical protein